MSLLRIQSWILHPISPSKRLDYRMRKLNKSLHLLILLMESCVERDAKVIADAVKRFKN